MRNVAPFLRGHCLNRIDAFDPHFGNSDHQAFFSSKGEFILAEDDLPFPPRFIVFEVLFDPRRLMTVDKPELTPLWSLGIDSDLISTFSADLASSSSEPGM
jgi:hypothetical protein